MHLFLLRFLIFMLFFYGILPHVNAQCDKDIFGFWKTTKGSYLKIEKINTGNRTTRQAEIGTKKVKYPSIRFYKSHYYEMEVNRELDFQTDTLKRKVDKKFEFDILEVDKQLMKIKPISDDMKFIFGNRTVYLFNESFVTMDNFVWDSLHYYRSPSVYKIKVFSDGLLSLQMTSSRHRKKKRDFQGQLDSNQLARLRLLILNSKITSLTLCELENYKNQACSCGYRENISLFYQEKLFQYRGSCRLPEAENLSKYLGNLIFETKWKRVKKKKLGQPYFLLW